MLRPQPIEDPLGRVPLLGWSLLVFFQNGVDHAYPRPQLGPPNWLLPPVARRNRVAQHLAHRLPRQSTLPRYLALAPALHQYSSPHTLGGRRLRPHGPRVRLRGVTLRHSTDESFEQRRNLVGGE